MTGRNTKSLRCGREERLPLVYGMAEHWLQCPGWLNSMAFNQMQVRCAAREKAGHVAHTAGNNTKDLGASV